MTTRLLVLGVALIVLSRLHVFGTGLWLTIVGGVLVVCAGIGRMRRPAGTRSSTGSAK